MTVISIGEECHGDIGIAKDLESAKDLLFKEGWIDECTDIFNDDEEWLPINEVLGSDWKAKVLNMTLKEFNEIFEDRFYLEVIEVYGT